jgi:type II secretory ATPase GspE/PulE/Tfp pilus assembly ATPase PilB-like protein
MSAAKEQGNSQTAEAAVGEILDQYGQQINTLAEQGQEKVADLVQVAITGAVEAQASDLHFDPTSEGVRVLNRVQGRLQEIARLPAELAPYVAVRSKVLADLQTHRTNIPQEGHIETDLISTPMEVRLSTLPSVWGECISFRFFDPDRTMRRITDLGLPPEVHQSLHEALELHDGLVLLSGPAGSGKTTTLYASLLHIDEENRGGRRIATIEDPVENELPGIVQTQVDRRVGLNFANSLRHVLRHDVEVIMLGEVRDDETAHIAVEASLTGHLVLSTVHAARAYTVPYRLLEMGVPSYALAGGLRLVIGQRLVRGLDPDLSRPPSDEEKEQIPDDLAETARVPEDGPHSRVGYGQRFLLAEGLTNREPLRKAIMEQAELSRFADVAADEGPGLEEQAVAAVQQGKTSWSEVRRALVGEKGFLHEPVRVARERG